jgi:hypothetical protein
VGLVLASSRCGPNARDFCYYLAWWPNPCPASPDPNSSVVLFCVLVWRPAMLTVIIIVAIILVALYVMRDRLPQLRR